MEQSRQIFHRRENDITGGKLSLLRGLSPLFFTGTIIAGGGGLLLLRAAGSIHVAGSYLPVLTTGSLMSCLVAGNLLLLGQCRLLRLSSTQKSGLTLSLVLPVLAGMLAVLPENGLNLTGILFFCLTYFMAFSGVLEWLNREALELADHDQVPEMQESTIEADSIDVDPDREKQFEALLSVNLPDSDLEIADEEQDGCTQWMNRNSDEAGFETIEGGILVAFEPHQKTRVVHLGLYPPLKGKLSVNCEFESGHSVRTRVLEARGYGISVEVKRATDLEQELQAVMQYRVSNQSPNEEVA